MARPPYVTPPTLPTDTITRCIEIPNSQQWLGIFNAALLSAAQTWNYTQVHDTDLTPQETAAVVYAIYEQYLTGDCGLKDVRQNPLDLCTLEKTFDGETWIPFANILACAAEVGAAQPFTTGSLQIDPLDPNNPQWSPDGGTTWIDIPPGGSTGPIVPPPGPTPGTLPSDKTCLASRRAALTLAEFYQATYGAFTAGTMNALRDLNSFLYDINRALFQLVYSPYQGVLEAALFGDQDFSHYATPTLDAGVVDALTCILQDNATADAGGVVTFDFTGVQTQIAAELTVNPALALQSILSYIQSPGLNTAGGVNVVGSYDCTDCLESCIFQSFAGQAQGWEAINVFGTDAGTLTPSGWQSVNIFGGQWLDIGISMTPTYVQEIVLTVDRPAPIGGGAVMFTFWHYTDGSSGGNTYPITGNDLVLTETIEGEIDFFDISIQNQNSTVARLENATIRWTGADPGFIGSPC